MIRKIFEDIDSYFDRDPAIRSKAEVILCYPGFHAMLFFRMSHKLWNLKFDLTARFISQLARFLTGIEIHPGATIGKGLFIDHGAGVVIGETAKIGDNVTLYHGVTLGGTSLKSEIRHPQLEDNIIIGAGAQLLGPIQVGSGAKIGSNAVVVKDVEADSTMVGVPARKVRIKMDTSEKEDHGFEAYGTAESTYVDPTRRDIERLIKEVESLKSQLDQVQKGN
ncbi:MAG: serine O-acetyltransferase [Rickettsiales bacterium]|nr:serine O-acetyltransferase [Rickettsiales bacterium]